MSLTYSPGVVTGLPILASEFLTPWSQLLTQSGYQSDGSDFTGFLALGVGGTVAAPMALSVTASGVTNALGITFNHSGGNVGFQEGHALMLAVNFTPATGTNRGMQSQKNTATLLGAGSSGGGIDGASMNALDLSALIDSSRTGTAAIVQGITSAVHKLNTVDDRTAGGTLIGGQFIADIQAGATGLITAAELNTSMVDGTTATEFYGLHVLQPVGGTGATVSTRMAGIYLDDWSVAAMAGQGATVAGGYAIYAKGGGVLLHDGDVEMESSATGLILRSPNNTRYRVTVDNAGALHQTAL